MLYIVIPPPDRKDAVFNQLYLADDGTPVMQYDLGRVADDRVYFSSSTSNYGLSDVESYDLANRPYALSQYVGRNKLRQVPFAYGGKIAVDTLSLQLNEFDNPICQWPYAVSLKISITGSTDVSLVLLRERDQPLTRSYRMSCVNGPGDVTLTTKYDIVIPELYETEKQTPLIGIKSPAMVLGVSASGYANQLFDLPGLVAIPESMSHAFFDSVAARIDDTAQAAVSRFENQASKLKHSHE